MDISNICTDRLKQILEDKRVKLEELYKSNDYLWIKNNKNIENDFYNFLIKYKYYFYKKKALNFYVEELYNDIIDIENELENRNISLDKLVLKKRFDNRSIL